MTATVIFQFGDDEPFTLMKLNANFANLAAGLNALSGDPLFQVGTVPGGSGGFLPGTGGQVFGQIGAPSLVAGAGGGAPHVGVVKQALASADTAPAAGDTYSQTQVQALLDELRDLKAKLRTAGVLAT